MAELTASTGPQHRSRLSFFVCMSALCVFFAFGGFTPTYFGPIATGELREVAPVVHIHGVLFFSWTLLFLLQSALVSRGNTALHRQLGLAGIAIATGMVIFGLMVNLLANERHIELGDLDRAYNSGFGGWFNVLSFGTMFALAIGNITRREHHKRWMLFATCMLLNAAVSRLYLPLFDFSAAPRWVVYPTIDVILIACLLYDWRSLGRPHFVTLVGGSVLLASQILRAPISETAIWRSTYDTLLRLVA